jgi:GTPase Era involved in 16S rRNA processing
VTDTPGLGDAKIPIGQWINLFNAQLAANERVDLCLIVVEKKERVENNTVFAGNLLD